MQLSTDPVITVRDGSFGYGDRAVVTHVDLDLHPGDVVAVLGPNGSGKTTLVKGLLGLDAHLGGDVELFGVPRRQFRDHARIGYVPQRHSLSASVRATVSEIVAVGRLPHRPWWRRASARDHQAVRDALQTVGLLDRADAEVATLSGGQQRRVLIARALAGDADVLVMDEPTAGVDAANQEVLATVLESLAAQGRTMLVVTHELEALELIVNRIVCIRAGIVDFDGSPQAYAAHEVAHARDHVHHHPHVLDEEPTTIVDDAGPLDAHEHRGAGHG
ncbi:ABC-type Mn/Zn transport systems ATPase component [Nostocoides japonicum T1-X7]|uniref:ABC-type Mn/Zn transport systems ATPase component n=1 Tax=Nostocoides japonicum T1-X7 TaxID=1194083 RepID=A0A077LWK0_9MICO|nr:ABC-type Mn/Zn transport systems ATPase component [Tetrasphaera japonica T1-X7]